MLKATLRKNNLAKRKTLSQLQLKTYNRQLLAGFKSLHLSGIQSIHVFLPIAHQNEPDTFAMIDYLTQTHPQIKIIVSISDFKQNRMSHFLYPGKAKLVLNAYQIPEPKNAQPYTGKIDMVLVPLLAFDVRGYRVGYGKGFYDQFLASLETKKIGLSFYDAIDEIKDIHLNDIKLDTCITPNRIYTF